MRHGQEPVYTLEGVFREDAPLLTFEEVDDILMRTGGRNFLFSRVFADSDQGIPPFRWYATHHRVFLNSLKKASGLKLRIPLPADMDPTTSISIRRRVLGQCRYLFSLADLIIFSPAPPWYCNYYDLDHPWPEFSSTLSGYVTDGTAVLCNSSSETIAFHAVMRPLIRAGKVAYLPRLGYDWEVAKLRLPKLKQQRQLSDLVARARGHREEPFLIARRAFCDLYIEQLVSERLGCRHVLGHTAQMPILTSNIALPFARDKDSNRAHITLRLRVPSIANASFEELWNIQQDEWTSFDLFRRSVEKAIQEVAATASSEAELQHHAQRIQRELIEEPLIKLEERMKRVEQIRRRKWAGYVLVSATVALVSALAPESAAPIIGGLGMVSLSKIMETYFSDLEKDVPLSVEALYWLARLRQAQQQA